MSRLRSVIRITGFAAIVLGVAWAWVIVLPPPAASQPLAFDHAKHRAIACGTCHAGVERSGRAGLPDGTFCAKCHATAPAAVAAESWARLVEPPVAPWVQLNRLPEHVHFSHQRHVGPGQLECASCHGDLGTRTSPAPRNPVRLEMDTCLSCHRRENVTEDCSACHR